MNIKEVTIGPFKSLATNRSILIQDITGKLKREEERIIDVLDGELEIGRYKALYICGDNADDIIKTSVEDFKVTELLGSANHYETLNDDIKHIARKVDEYKAIVQVVDKQIDYLNNGKRRETIETRIVFLTRG